MTERLFDQDSFLTEFDAKVISCEKCQEGYRTVLDRTCFFPEGGGQKGDTGFLGSTEVFDTQIIDDVIYHYTSEPVVCDTVKGKIDFDKRLDRMQNHSGEHIISGIVYSLFGFANVGFHLGEEEMTMDYSGFICENDLEKVISLANKAVRENRQIRCYYPENPNEVPYRSKKELKGKIRIVDIDGIDVCACCAPHVNSTGQVGAIVLKDAKKFKGGIRLTVLCGSRATNDIIDTYRKIKRISQKLSVPYDKADTAFFDHEEKSLQREQFFKNQLFSLTKKEIDGLEYKDGKRLYRVDDPQFIKDALNMLKEKCSDIACVISGNDESGYRFMAVNVRDEKDFKKNLCLRCGGRDGMLQGTINNSLFEIETYFN